MLRRKIGFEIELLAPRGMSRRDLAEALADRYGGRVRRIFYPQSEPSKVPGQYVFHNLILGFRVTDGKGNWLASCVDDLTLQGDLVKSTPPLPGWYRILSDDLRLLNLVVSQADAEAPLEKVLEPLARLFQSEVKGGPGGMFRVADADNTPVAIAAPLPGERERPCELITAPLETDHAGHLTRMLEAARELGFQVPVEGATHLHFDGAEFQNARRFSRLVQLLDERGEELKQKLGVNPNCRRLGSWPSELQETVEDPSFLKLEWPEARERLLKLPLTKYCDFNLVNLLTGKPDKTTLEIRILPVWLEPEPILEATRLVEELLDEV